MKTPIILSLLTVLLVMVASASAENRTPTAVPSQTAAYVSDQVEIPLRAGASNRYKIIGAVRSGAPIEVLKVDPVKGYTQIRTPANVKGWIQSEQLTHTPSSQELLAGVRRELERLQAQHADLKQHLNELISQPNWGNLSYPQLYEEAVRLRQQLAHYHRVATHTVAIDERNKALQEQAVAQERELRIVQQENQTLRNDNNTIRFLMGAVLLSVAVLGAVLMPRIREQRRTQWSRL